MIHGVVCIHTGPEKADEKSEQDDQATNGKCLLGGGGGDSSSRLKPRGVSVSGGLCVCSCIVVADFGESCLCAFPQASE